MTLGYIVRCKQRNRSQISIDSENTDAFSTARHF
jgi:hypothetical protein